MERSVRKAERDGREVEVVAATRIYATDAADLWDAITDPARLVRWFLPVSGDLRVGGRFQLEGNAGGQVLVCEPPWHLGVTWEFGDQTSWVDVHLRDLGGGRAEFVLEHAVPPDAHWDEFGPGAVGVGWDMGLYGLERYVAGNVLSADAAAAWSASDEGRAFVRESSEGWCRAHVDAGEDPATARARADRTTAAYTAA